MWVLPLDGDRQPVAIAQTAFEESEGRFSPDGRWIAYQSNDTGRNEIYVQPFPFVAGGTDVPVAPITLILNWKGAAK